MDIRDSRRSASQILKKIRVKRHIPRSLFMILLAAIIAISVATLPSLLGWEYFDTLPGLGKISLGIVIFAAFLWISEAIPVYSVSVFIVGLNVLLLSYTGWGGKEAKGSNIFGMSEVLTKDGVQDGSALVFSSYLAPWASNLMWLFMAGFVLAQALTKTKLDLDFAKVILKTVGSKPINVLFGAMITTFILSMFVSNTATTAMMVAMMASFVRVLPSDEPFAKALFLGVPVAANVGGMGTIIGTPPNGIAVEALAKQGINIDFLSWMAIGLPIAIILFIVGFIFIWKWYKPTITKFEMDFDTKEDQNLSQQQKNKIRNQRIVTLVVFAVTVLLWVTGKLHHISTYVIALIPIVVLGATSIVDASDFRKLPWDILMLLTGGLSMGIAIQKTGLGIWMSGLVPTGVSVWMILVIMIILAIIMSNLLSNTVTASILVPIVITMIPESTLIGVVTPIALVCSAAMFLPISTPPNAVAFSSGRLETKDFMKIGGVMAIAGPIVAGLWGSFIVRFIM